MNLSEEILQLLDSSATNVICKDLELKPQNLAMFIATLSNMPCEYGYIVIGVSKNSNKYIVNGISPGFKIKNPIEKALSLLSDKPEINFESILIHGKNVVVIKVKSVETNVFLKAPQESDSYVDRFIRNLFIACAKLQARKTFANVIEDVRNDQIVDLLTTSGYVIKDQSRRGSSSAGKESGEIDILVERDGLSFAIIEALNLDSLKKEYLGTHLDKIYLYDTTGNAINVCLSYVKIKDFGAFWEKYCKYAREHDYPITLISSNTNADIEYNYSEIRFMTTTHNRSGKLTTLYHMCVKMHE